MRFARATHADALRLCTLVEEWGFDAVTPVEVSVFPDTTLARGGTPDWSSPAMASRLRRAAPGKRRRMIIETGARWGARRAHFQPVWNRALIAEVKQRVGIPVFAVGGIRTAAEVRDLLDRKHADLIGIGRPFYAEPDLAARILAGDDGPRRCRNSNQCVAAQLLGMKGVCYNPDVRRVSRSD